MAPMAEGDITNLSRANGALVPTKSTKATLRFTYVVRRGSLSDRLFRLEMAASAPPPYLGMQKAGGPAAPVATGATSTAAAAFATKSAPPCPLERL